MHNSWLCLRLNGGVHAYIDVKKLTKVKSYMVMLI